MTIKPNKSFRISPELLAKAQALDLPITEIFEAALAEVLKHEACPYCGQEYKSNTDTANKLRLVLNEINEWGEAGNIHHFAKFMYKINKVLK